MVGVKDEFLSEEDLDLSNLSEAELHAYWDLWLHQAQASNDLDSQLYSHGVFLEEPRREASPLLDRERRILDFLLEGRGNVLVELRAQLAHAQVIRRSHSGVGFFLDFEQVETVRPLAGRPTFQIGDVVADVRDVKHGMGILLFIKDGIATMLEGYTFDEVLPWVWEPVRLQYVDALRNSEPPIIRPAGAPRRSGTRIVSEVRENPPPYPPT